jgi:hypothetical protein
MATLNDLPSRERSTKSSAAKNLPDRNEASQIGQTGTIPGSAGRKIVGLSQREGLVTDVDLSDNIRAGPQLCEDDVLSASIGFGLLRRDDGRVWEDAEVWEGRSVRRLNRLWLDHLAFVPNPAHPGATVLDVRSSQEPPGRDAMPNRDSIITSELQAAHEALNRRWLKS